MAQLEYTTIADTTSDYGTRRITVKVDNKLYNFKDNGDAMPYQVYMAMIQAEPNMGKKQDIARRRYTELGR